MSRKSRETSAHFIIHSVAVAAAAFSFAFSWAPGVGPTLGDTAVLTGLTVAMTMMIGDLFDKQITESSAWAVGTVAIGYALGTSLLKGAISFIPGVGPFANAAITLSLHEAISWGLYTIFDSGYNPVDMTPEEIKDYFRMGREVSDNYKEKSKEMDRVKKTMSPADQEIIADLEKKIASKDVSQEERRICVEKIAHIYRKYDYLL